MRLLAILFVLLALAGLGCTESVNPQVAEPSVDGDYILTFKIGEGIDLPVNVKIESELVRVFNGPEEIAAVDVKLKDDSLGFRMPAFNNRFIFEAANDGFTGLWHNYVKGDQYTIPVELRRGTERFAGSSTTDVSGDWRVLFSGGTEGEYVAKGIFTQQGSVVNGTFRTTTGDYRFLQGVVAGDLLRLSCFDGAHLFLFEARVQGDTLAGTFYSGKHWQEPWTASRVEEYELPDPDTLTFIKEGQSFDFSFPDVNGETVAFADYAGKPTIVQITGTWCPNCMDETRLLNKLYDKYHSMGLEIVALAFEPTADPSQAVEYIKRFASDMEVRYPILVAGTSRKSEAGKSLPMLNHIMSYPTTLFFDKQGSLLKIHTGFNGPSTGEIYTDFVAEVTGLIEKKML